MGNHVFNGTILIKKPPENFCTGIWVTVDPGDNTAIQIWANGLQEVNGLMTFRNCLEHMPFILVHNSANIIIENCELRRSSKSWASGVRGDLFKLAMFTGALINHFRQKTNGFIYLVNYINWGGQLNYKKMRHIFETKFGIKVKNDHEAAAVGIGLWAKGIF